MAVGIKNRLLNISDNSVYSSSFLSLWPHLDQEGFNSF